MPKVSTDSKGNFIQASRETNKPTGKTYTDNQGGVHDVYQTRSGNYFVKGKNKKGNSFITYLKVAS